MDDPVVASEGRQVHARTVAGAPLVDMPFATALLDVAARRSDVVVLSADLSKYTDVLPFADAYPDRFFQIGMAEQNMMGIAGGLAKTGCTPIAVTYCVFAARRACDQIQMALSTGNRTAVVVAFLPGITTPFRATHQGTDDLAIMRSVPGMTVIDPVDATELGAAIRTAVTIRGPVYVRGLRGQVAEILEPPYELEIGKGLLLRDGDEVGMIGTGIGTQWALETAELLAAQGVAVAVLHVPTVKPLPVEQIRAFAGRFRAVLTIENHSVVGGLGSAVAEVLADSGSGCRLRRLGVPDRWGEAGPLDYIRERLGLDAPALAKHVNDHIGGTE